MIFFYTKTKKSIYTWNKLYQPYDESYINQFYTHKDDDGRRWKRSDLTGAGTVKDGETGKPWRGIDVTQKGRHWANKHEQLEQLDVKGMIHWPKKPGGMPRLKEYLDEQPGVLLQDIWTDIRAIHNRSPERLGYDTQKPISLLQRIVEASSNEGDVVFDPFCGCGTTVYAANLLGRQWIGCDIAMLAVQLIQTVLRERYELTEGKDYEVSGIPVSVEQAEALFKQNPFHFQDWIVERAGGFPSSRKTADRGIDGWMYFELHDKELKEMVLSVKGGHIRPTDIRDLRGVLEREPDAELAGFLSMRTPTPGMRREAAEAGVYSYMDRDYDRIQMLTVEQVLDGQEFKAPFKVVTKIHTGQTTFEL